MPESAIFPGEYQEAPAQRTQRSRQMPQVAALCAGPGITEVEALSPVAATVCMGQVTVVIDGEHDQAALLQLHDDTGDVRALSNIMRLQQGRRAPSMAPAWRAAPSPLQVHAPSAVECETCHSSAHSV